METRTEIDSFEDESERSLLLYQVRLCFVPMYFYITQVRTVIVHEKTCFWLHSCNRFFNLVSYLQL